MNKTGQPKATAQPRQRTKKTAKATKALTKALSPTPEAPKKRGPKVDVEQARLRKQAILNSAARLFDEVGYHGVTMPMIAECVDLKAPTLYYYFSGKDKILFDIHELLLGRLQENLDKRIKEGLNSLEILRCLMFDIFTNFLEYPGYIRAFFEHARELNHDQRVLIAKKRRRFMETVWNVIEKAMDEGLINRADTEITANCLFGISNWAYQWYRPSRHPSPEQLAEQCWNVFLQGLAPR